MTLNVITDRAMRPLLARCIVPVTLEPDRRALQPESMHNRYGTQGLPEKIHGRRAEYNA